MSEQLSADDLIYYRKAVGDMRTAQSVLQFLAQVLTEKYKLQGTDHIDDDGTIVRGNAMEAAD